MRYWHVYFDANKQQYQMLASNFPEVANNLLPINSLVVFAVFDMAYDYVTKANRMTDVMAYSRWAR